MIQTDIHWEVTDTYGGEANYAWVKRGKIECKPGENYTDLAAVRRAKKSAGWENLRCKRGHPDKIYLIQGKSGLRVEYREEVKEMVEA